MKKSMNMFVYPNPSSGSVTVKLPEYGRYNIYNQMGQMVESSTELLGEGFYYLVSMDKSAPPAKFIIIK